MRLASKIFLGFSLVILVLAAVGVLSLRAVGRLVSLNREVASETLPALRLTGDVRDTMLALARLEARYTILRDPRYVMVWAERADAVHADLARLRALARTEDEARQLADAAAAFKQYREAVRRWPSASRRASRRCRRRRTRACCRRRPRSRGWRRARGRGSWWRSPRRSRWRC